MTGRKYFMSKTFGVIGVPQLSDYILHCAGSIGGYSELSASGYAFRQCDS
jgi:hypothetical protein